MKIARTVCIKYSFFILLALLTSGAMLVHRAAFAQEETFVNVFQIIVPGGLNSFDIGFVDPKLGLYFLADRTNKTIDQVNTSDNSITQLAPGELVGPNGVITANNHKEVWEGDTDSHVRVINLKTGKVTHAIDTGGQQRADELCEDPIDHVVLVANDEDVDLFLTFIDTKTYAAIGNLTLKGNDPKAKNVEALNGIEQCQWSPRTGKFYLAVPQVKSSSVASIGPNTTPGAVLKIDPVSMKVEEVFPINFHFLAGSLTTTPVTPATADCLGPQGLTIGPGHEILLGCSNGGTVGNAPAPVIRVAQGQGSVIIDERDGSELRNLPGLNGNDEVWYNPGDNHYFLAGSNHNLNIPKPGPILGVDDQHGDPVIDDDAASTAAGSHSVAADPVFNQVYVPGNQMATSICPSGNGCIAVFVTANHDLGICGGKETAFKRHVCPRPGEN